MPPTYADAAALLFGERPFTAAEFRRRTGNPRAAKVLHELKRRGVVERVGRGRYRLLGPAERPDRRADEWRRVRRNILEAGLAFAWTGPTAVERWTEGRYTVSPSVLVHEFHMAVPEEAVEAWTAFLLSRGITTEPRKRIGARVIIHPIVALGEIEELNGEPVASRDEVVHLIRDHPAIYAGAEELLVERPGRT